MKTYSVLSLMEQGYSVNEAELIYKGIEIGRKIAYKRKIAKAIRVNSPEVLHDIVKPLLAGQDKENFLVVVVDCKNKVIGQEIIAKGSINSCTVNPREVVQIALRYNGAGLFVAHNHPSGEIAPSTADKELTKNLFESSKVLAIPLMDHIIVGDNDFYSFKEGNEL